MAISNKVTKPEETKKYLSLLNSYSPKKEQAAKK